MKQFPRIISKLLYEPVVITPNKHAAICQVVEAHMASNKPKLMDDDDGDGDYEADDDLNYRQVGNTAIIPIHGVIGKHLRQMASAAPGCDLDDLDGLIDIAEEDSSVERVIYDFRTPGGSVTGIPESARKILRSSKETIAFTDDECCSGGMWLASQCQKLYCTASATLGSVGVWCAYMDYSRQMANDGENMQAISAGKYKLLGAYWKTLSDEEKSILQKGVDKIYAQFKSAVSEVRNVSEMDMGNGLVFDGEEACERGLADGTVEGIEDILQQLVE